MTAPDFDSFLTDEERKMISEEATRRAAKLVFESPDQLSAAVKLYYDNLRYQAIIRRLTAADPPATKNLSAIWGNEDTAPPEDAQPDENNEDFRITTSVVALNLHPDAVYATLQLDADGTLKMRNAGKTGIRSLLVVIDGLAYPNPQFFTGLRRGTKGFELERLKPVFQIRGIGSSERSYALRSVTPAKVVARSRRSFNLSKKGILNFKSI